MIFVVLSFLSRLDSQWHSSIVYPGSGGALIYKADSKGNRIPDFSYSGYKNGNVQIPTVPVVDTVAPMAGDNTLNVQSAINRVAARPLGANGFRGALLMRPGKYRVSTMVNLNASGVVLIGAGDGSDSLTNTIIVATGDSLSQPAVLVAGGGGLDPSNNSVWPGKIGSKVNITSDTVYVGTRTIQVADVSQFSPGDNIVLFQDDTTPWKRAVEWGGVPNDTGVTSYWANANLEIKYNRFITSIQSATKTITVDVPIYTTLVRALSQSVIYKTDRAGILTNIGIENIRVDIINPFNQSPAVDGDERHHAQDAIYLGMIEDAWVRHCTVLHFVRSGFITAVATRVTIDSCNAIDPIGTIDGQRRYNFDSDYGSQMILFSNCYAKYGRHSYAVNGTSTVSGIVFYNCISERAFAPSEGHRLWSQGLLYDNYHDMNRSDSPTERALGLYDRGDGGSGHGWSAAHSVAWNCSVGTGTIIIQRPPTAQNYSVGCSGVVSGVKPPAPFDQPEGYIEGTNIPGINPSSLYMKQLGDRMKSMTSVNDSRTEDLERNDITTENNTISAYPNPFNPATTIRYRITSPSVVRLTICDLLGKELDELVNEFRSAGTYQAEWNASNHSSGLYFCMLKTGSSIIVQRISYLK